MNFRTYTIKTIHLTDNPVAGHVADGVLFMSPDITETSNIGEMAITINGKHYATTAEIWSAKALIAALGSTKTVADMTKAMAFWVSGAGKGDAVSDGDDLLLKSAQTLIAALHWLDSTKFPADPMADWQSVAVPFLKSLRYRVATLTNYRDDQTVSLAASPIKYGYYDSGFNSIYG